MARWASGGMWPGGNAHHLVKIARCNASEKTIVPDNRLPECTTDPQGQRYEMNFRGIIRESRYRIPSSSLVGHAA